jgi:hypothetical protein
VLVTVMVGGTTSGWQLALEPPSPAVTVAQYADVTQSLTLAQVVTHVVAPASPAGRQPRYCPHELAGAARHDADEPLQ